MSMIAAVMIEGDLLPHPVYLTKKQGLVTVVTKAWCGKEVPAGDGVYQLPDNAPCCPACEAAITTAREAYAKARAAKAQEAPTVP